MQALPALGCKGETSPYSGIRGRRPLKEKSFAMRIERNKYIQKKANFVK